MKKIFYVWRNTIWSDEETLNDVLYEHYNQDSDSTSFIESRVESAYDNGTVDKYFLDVFEFVKMLDDGYKYEEVEEDE